MTDGELTFLVAVEFLDVEVSNNITVDNIQSYNMNTRIQSCRDENPKHAIIISLRNYEWFLYDFQDSSKNEVMIYWSGDLMSKALNYKRDLMSKALNYKSAKVRHVGPNDHIIY